MTYVAIASGEVPYDGRLERITAEVTYVADGHEIVERFPHMFERASSALPRSRRSGARSTAANTDRPARAPKAVATKSTSIAPKELARAEIELRASATV